MDYINIGTIIKSVITTLLILTFNRYITILYFIKYYYYKKIKDISKIKNIGNSQFLDWKIIRIGYLMDYSVYNPWFLFLNILKKDNKKDNYIKTKSKSY